MSTPYTAFPNRLRLQLRTGEPLIGCWLSLGSPISTEVVGVAGFDWLLIDGEHAPNDLRTVLGQLQAVAPYPAHAIVRPVISDVALIKQLLDVGAQTLLIPVVETAEQAATLVAATRYPPRGIRGAGRNPGPEIQHRHIRTKPAMPVGPRQRLSSPLGVSGPEQRERERTVQVGESLVD